MAETLKDWLSGSLPDDGDPSTLESATHYEPGEPSDELKLGDENAALEAVFEVLGHLEQLQTDIRDAGGMTQQFAMEAQQLLVVFDRDTPLAYYTKNPSRTRLAVANEEINKGMWAAIAAGVAALLAVVYKVVRWLMGSSSSDSAPASSSASSSNKTPTEQAKEVVKEATEVAKEAPEAVAQTKESASEMVAEAEPVLGAFVELLKNDKPLPEAPDGGPIYMVIGKDIHVVKSQGDVMTCLLASRDNEGLDTTDAINELVKMSNYDLDLVESGPYTKSIIDLTGQIQDFTRLSGDRLQLIKEFIAEYGQYYEPHGEVWDEPDNISRNLGQTLDRLDERFAKLPPSTLHWGGHSLLARDLASALREKREELRAQHEKPNAIFTKMMDDVLTTLRPDGAMNRVSQTIVPLSDQLLTLAQAIETVSAFIDGGLQNNSGTGLMNAQISARVSKRLGDLHQDVIDVTQVCMIMRAWVKDWRGAMNLSLTTRKAVARAFSDRLVDGSRNHVSNPEWRERTESLVKITVKFRDQMYAWMDKRKNRRKT